MVQLDVERVRSAISSTVVMAGRWGEAGKDLPSVTVRWRVWMSRPDVIDDGIAEDIVHADSADLVAGFADDDSEFGLVSGWAPDLREDDRCTGADD